MRVSLLTPLQYLDYAVPNSYDFVPIFIFFKGLVRLYQFLYIKLE